MRASFLNGHDYRSDTNVITFIVSSIRPRAVQKLPTHLACREKLYIHMINLNLSSLLINSKKTGERKERKSQARMKMATRPAPYPIMSSPTAIRMAKKVAKVEL